MHINSEWDKEYREQEEAFHRYRYDAQQAQTENHTFIQRLKEKIATLEEERERMQDELTRYQREGHTLRERLATLESMKTAVGGVGVDKMEEEIALLRQQVSFKCFFSAIVLRFGKCIHVRIYIHVYSLHLVVHLTQLLVPLSVESLINSIIPFFIKGNRLGCEYTYAIHRNVGGYGNPLDLNMWNSFI